METPSTDHRQHHEHQHHGHHHPGDADPSAQAAHTVDAEPTVAAFHDHPQLAHDTPAPEHAMHGPAHGAMQHRGAHPGGHAGGHTGHAGHSEEMFRRPFWISLALTVPILIYAPLFQQLLHYTAPPFPGSAWLSPLLASVVYWYCGWVFLVGAVEELRARLPGMMTLVALAISTAYFYSLAITFGLVAGMSFYWELATLVTIMLLGHWMELRAVKSAQSALKELAKLLPDLAERVVPDAQGHAGQETEHVPVAALRVGDLVLVRPGASVPADGRVVDGESQVNESLLTGESRPVHKHPGDEVIGGTVNGSGALRVKVTRVGDQTMLSGIMKLVAEAQSSRGHAQALADRAAFLLTLVAVGVAVVTFVAWAIARGIGDFTLERAVTVLVTACPHALGLAIPLVIAISTTLSARHGILVRDRQALEDARNLTVVVFDKTGTLTEGTLGLVDLAAVPDHGDEAQALGWAAAVEADSEHPLARAIVAGATQRGVRVPTATSFVALPGRGAQARVGGRTLQVGGPRLLEQGRIALPEPLAEKARTWGERGQTVVFLVDGEQVLAAFALADVIRPESREAVAALQQQGVRVAMLTGDSEPVARWVAGELGIDEYFARVLPQFKSEQVAELQRGGAKVAMVGDGVNDAPALAQADVGIAIGAGTDVARAAAGIVLVRNDPRDVADIIQLSRATYRKMVQNLAWAVGYNVVALPLAAGVLAFAGFVLPAWAGAALMSLSTIIVAINAQTLRGLRFDTDRAEGTTPTEGTSSTM